MSATAVEMRFAEALHKVLSEHDQIASGLDSVHEQLPECGWSLADLGSEAAIQLGRSYKRELGAIRSAVASDNPTKLVEALQSAWDAIRKVADEYERLRQQLPSVYAADGYAQVYGAAREVLEANVRPNLAPTPRDCEQLRWAIGVARGVIKHHGTQMQPAAPRSKPKGKKSKGAPGVCQKHGCETPHPNRSAHDREVRAQMRGTGKGG